MTLAISKRFIIVSAALFVALWIFMLMAVLSTGGAHGRQSIRSKGAAGNFADTSSASGSDDPVSSGSRGSSSSTDTKGSIGDSIGDSSSTSGNGKVVNRKPVELRRSFSDSASSSSSSSSAVRSMEIKPLSPPKRYTPLPQQGIEPPSIAEVERNITIFLRTLHARLSSLASSQINPIDALNAYMDVTKNTLLKWDDMNKDRYWKQRR